jgi:secondary thiamine-phosphate synthase enzyme
MHELQITTERKSHVVDITDQVREALSHLAGDKIDGAAVLVYVPHTTAGVTINEGADPAVGRDFEMALPRIVDDSWPWEHIEPHEDNAPTHVRTSLIGPQVVIPVREGSLALGQWQSIFFCEFDGPRTRSVYVSILQ